MNKKVIYLLSYVSIYLFIYSFILLIYPFNDMQALLAMETMYRNMNGDIQNMKCDKTQNFRCSVHLCLHTHTRLCARAHVHACMHTYVLTHLHTYTHANKTLICHVMYIQYSEQHNMYIDLNAIQFNSNTFIFLCLTR